MVEISNITPAANPVPPTSHVLVSNQVTDSTTSAVASTKSSSSSTANVNELKSENGQILSPQAVHDAADAGNKLLQSATASRNLQFQIDETTNQVIIKVVDDKGQVIRQIPTVEMLDFIHAMKELEGNSGKLIQARA